MKESIVKVMQIRVRSNRTHKKEKEKLLTEFTFKGNNKKIMDQCSASKNLQIGLNSSKLIQLH